MNANPKITKKLAAQKFTLQRPNFKSIHGGIIIIPVPRRQFSATAVPQNQGYGENAKRNTHTI